MLDRKIGTVQVAYFATSTVPVVFLFFFSLLFPIAIPANINTTPSHCVEPTCSCKTKADMITATGSSDAVRMVPSPGPTCGIPIENNNGGNTTPKMPKYNPYGATPANTLGWSKKVGGNKV